MAVTTTKTNKPINPRANDQSPKGYNRASLFSGKALDFDGVNDYVDLDGFTMAGNVATICFYAQFDNDGYLLDLNPNRLVIKNHNTQGFQVYNNNAWTVYDTTDMTTMGFYVIVSDGTTQRAYYNGHQLSGDKTITAIDFSAITEFKLGSYHQTGSPWYNGKIAGFRIFNTALTADQVSDLYNNPEKIVPTGVDNDALKLWLPMMEGAGTTAFNGSPDALGSELITNGDFSDGTNNWTAVNAVIYASNNQITVDDSTNLGGDSRATQTFTTEVGKKYRLVFTKVSTTSSFNLGIGADASYSDIVYVGLGTDTGIHTIDFTATSTTTKLALITGGTGISVFANVSIKEQTGFGTISGATWTHGVGAPVAQTAVIDWNKVSDGTSDVLLPAGLTTGRDITGVNLFENVRKQGALNLDGNSWAEVHDNASLDITDAVSIEMWIYWEDQSAESTILGKWLSGTNRAYALIATTTTGEIDFRQRISSSTYSLGISTLSSGWNHVVATHDHSANERKGYINGVEVSTSSSQGVSNASDNNVTIGGSATAQYNNNIAQPRIYNRALTAEEVERNYNAGKNIYK